MTESTTTKGLLAVLCLTTVALQSALANDAFFVEGGMGPADFDEDLFEGDGNLLSMGLGYRYGIDSGFGENPSLELGMMFGELSIIDVSRGDEDDLSVSVFTFYLRYDQQLADKVSGFGQFGYSSLEVENHDTSCTTGFIFPDCSTTRTYRNRDKGISWGVGLNFRTRPNYLLSIGYFDFSQSDIDLTTWRLALRHEFN